MIKTKLKFWIPDKKIEEWANSKNIFFMLAIGRSGTKFLADLLNKAPGAYVVHEPVREDFQAYQEAFHSDKKGIDYVQSFRKKEIYLRARSKNIETYGEVNPALRRHCHALKQAFPNATFIHLVRDGRDVIRSMMSRNTMTSKDPNTRRIYPTNGDRWYDEWGKMNRFEKLCWYWQVANGYLRNSIPKTIQFEKLISSYEYFRENLLDPLNINITKDVWREATAIPKNSTKKYTIPDWSNWGSEKTETFWKICGEELLKNGYTFQGHK